MKVHIYLKNMRDGGISREIIAAYRGFKQHGIEPRFYKPGDPRKCDLAVCWGVKKKLEMKSGRRALILERGYVGDRQFWTSCGFGGLNGRADFLNRNSPGDRWALHHAEAMKPWQPNPDGYVLLIGQVRGDASIRGFDFEAWVNATAKSLIERGERVRFRDHPLQKAAITVSGVENSNEFLEHDLVGAKYVVTYNSNTGVDSVLAGIPAVTCDRGAMAWDVTGHDPLTMPEQFDRTQWANDLAYCQWSIEEIESGAMWDHLKRGMEQSNAAAA
jgi:hypothetical protein